MIAGKLVRKRCDTYLAYTLDTNVDSVVLQNLCMVTKFLDVFREELFGLPPEREVEFGIKLLLEIASMSIAPYHMASKEVKEFKA